MKHLRGARTSIDIGGVLHTGRALVVRESVTLPGFGTFEFPEPVDVALTIDRLGGGLDLSGSLAAVAAGECARCLEPVRLALAVDVDERIDPAGERIDPFAENNVLAGDELDLGDLVRQLIDSALPLSLLCSATCPGLCAACGLKRDGDCRCTDPE